LIFLSEIQKFRAKILPISGTEKWGVFSA
jgi:hypothetical protein